MAFISNHVLFKNLSDEQEASFRNWARENWNIGKPIEEIWHPVVLDEVANMIKKLVNQRGEFVAENKEDYPR